MLSIGSTYSTKAQERIFYGISSRHIKNQKENVDIAHAKHLWKTMEHLYIMLTLASLGQVESIFEAMLCHLLDKGFWANGKLGANFGPSFHIEKNATQKTESKKCMVLVL